MFKLFSAILAASAVGAGTAAQACGGNCHCPCHGMTMTAPPQAKHAHEETAKSASEQPRRTARAEGRRTYRSFSYEPGMAAEAAPSYATPRMSSSMRSMRSRAPAYLLPKSDPRRYSVR